MITTVAVDPTLRGTIQYTGDNAEDIRQELAGASGTVTYEVTGVDTDGALLLRDNDPNGDPILRVEKGAWLVGRPYSWSRQVGVLHTPIQILSEDQYSSKVFLAVCH